MLDEVLNSEPVYNSSNTVSKVPEQRVSLRFHVKGRSCKSCSDNFSSAECSLQSVLTTSLLLFMQVFDDPKKKRNFMLIMAVTLGLFIIYLLAQRARKQ